MTRRYLIDEPPPALMVITDTTVAPMDVWEERIEQLLSQARPRSVLVQLRDLTLPVRERFAFAKRLVAICRRHEQWFSVNDRLDLALLLDADSVHLGERSLAPADARTVLPRAFISHACHDVEGVFVPGSNAAVLSPIMAARKGRVALGADGVRRARAEIERRGAALGLYALGGVDDENAAACVAAGATGVAVVGAAVRTDTPVILVRALRLDRH